MRLGFLYHPGPVLSTAADVIATDLKLEVQIEELEDQVADLDRQIIAAVKLGPEYEAEAKMPIAAKATVETGLTEARALILQHEMATMQEQLAGLMASFEIGDQSDMLERARALANAIWKEGHRTTLVFVGQEDAYSPGLADNFQRWYQCLGGRVITNPFAVNGDIHLTTDPREADAILVTGEAARGDARHRGRILVIWMTNRPHAMDETTKRPGRDGGARARSAAAAYGDGVALTGVAP
jgi:SpoVK/Ycf46/Vps4 family AAA+-type ATPase